jgi:aldehyde:ferredoxin oxidoreductase
MGIGYKIIWDEVPLDTHPYAPEAKAVIATGPFTGTTVPCAGRTNISFLTNYTRAYSICDAHMGGHWAAYMKYAGYDAIIVEGQSPTPVYVKIEDGNVSFVPAGHLWGKGTFETNKTVMEECGPEFTSMAIGPAGENLVNQSIVHTSQGNAGGGGIGAVFGSKNLKALACRGTGSIPIANPRGLADLTNYMLEDILGATNNHPVPALAQPWARWTNTTMPFWQGHPSRYWENAPDGPVNLGYQFPGDKNSIGFRVQQSFRAGGGAAAHDFVAKQGGCSMCPLSCYPRWESSELANAGYSSKYTQACLTMTENGGYYPPGGNALEGYTAWQPPEGVAVGFARNLISAKALDDLGLWENYGRMHTD